MPHNKDYDMLKKEKDLMFFGLNANQSSLEGVWLFLFIYVGASLFASVLTAPTYWLIQWIDSMNSTETTQWLLGKRVDVFYDRLRWAPIIIGLPWMMKRCGMFSWRNIGMPFSKRGLSVFSGGFLLGVGIALAIIIMQHFAYGTTIEEGMTLSIAMSIAARALIGGLILGFLEEIVMRGLIMRSLYTAWGPIAAIVLSSLFFAYKHFKVPSSIWQNLPGEGHIASWDSGFFVAYYDTVGIAMKFSTVSFLCLFMFGAVLALLYIRTKLLWGPISLHAGIVFCMLTFGDILSIPKGTDTSIFGGSGLTNGFVPLGVLTVIFIALLFAWPKKKAENECEKRAS